MKDLLRQRVAVQDSIIKKLNNQVKLEAQASAAYLAMAAWCDQNAYDHSAKFFYEQSSEEREHMMKLFHYISDMGGIAVSPAVAGSQSEFSSLKEVFETALENEINVTESINQIVSDCRKNNDFATENFMQWFVKEQVEEEFVIRRILDYFEMLGEDPKSLLMIDERVGGVSYGE
ncbi:MULTISPECIES: ferritin [Reichenbachiella]|uniref:Ferritin n=1 Tax=Reichenbachiella agariperforans TaxID=156994 RepID=A0A1M6L9N3_REIAG|nr:MULTISPECIES: ferritin [Reichenbachiella]MBU2913841.1 ferritin [Reichenbachiella agariperforans]RJE74239.1 ferritin [Reichenbachiella sp. MSK19-1]SHJ67863.1 ferritin [Reichenbachiella agariperforans]